ncbi:MAG TPA: HAMP domain-containing sensor histidine kinase [Pseudomonas sp.]|uniref:sensor histidine kinase n=1 Tax=Pseudomonas sp. TaxID=306 RepID=UPI002B4879B5|nr:HAMP domain-containing sensor histidine kinase [Pseudomonas sp.]HKS15112.1 HAMP domain-containing sensor histidine kinase [Pseudomonas sp.]
MLYIQGSFDLDEELTTPTYAKSPTTGHYFLVSLDARGTHQTFIITFDPLRLQNPASRSAFSPTWSMNGFKYLGSPQKAFTREPEIKGRILLSESSNNHYRYILQIPIQAFAADAVRDDKPWPPTDLDSLKVNVQIASPDNAYPGRIVTDTADIADSPKFAFGAMSEHLASGETLTFRAPGAAGESSVIVESSQTANKMLHRSTFRTTFEQVADAFIRMVVPTIATQKLHSFPDGSSVELNGNASLVLSGWRAAAQGIIGFALLLCVSIVLAGFVLYRFLLKPLNNVRRNTLYLRGKFQDEDHFKFPYVISNEKDEIGVLWESILDLHNSISSYGREALEKTNKQAAFLRALGHEIKSPLQELTMRHRDPEDASYKSIKRITHALKILSAPPAGSESNTTPISPKEAIKAFQGTMTRENVSEYLQNAAEVYSNLIYAPPSTPLIVSADGDMLEAALTAILNNANDFRSAGTSIKITTYTDSNWVVIYIMNYGPHILNQFPDEIFEYGVSSREGEYEHQGLGLYMARQNVQNMGGDLVVKNVKAGVRFDMKLVRAK